MISINKIQVESLIKTFKIEIDEHHKKAYKKLNNLRNNNYLTNKESSFLRLMIREFKNKNLVSLSLADVKNLSTKMGEIPITKKRRFAGKTKKSYLKDEILNALDYTGKRSSFYPKYFQKLGIKSCVYCNSQLTISIKKNRKSKEYKGRFQVDHYYPKSKYPYLSIALYNLYPTCASCNLVKSNEIIDFELYTDTVNKDIFHFQLDKASKAKFLITRNVDDLEVTFVKNDDAEYLDIFNINEIYDTQKDIAEEIILKALAYNQTLREFLKNIPKTDRIDNNLIDRFVLGNYTNPEEIHRRPMAKFMQDLGKEVGLI